MAGQIFRPAVVDVDLAEHASFIGRDSPDAGLRFLDAAEASFQLLAEFPGLAENGNREIHGWLDCGCCR